MIEAHLSGQLELPFCGVSPPSASAVVLTAAAGVFSVGFGCDSVDPAVPADGSKTPDA